MLLSIHNWFLNKIQAPQVIKLQILANMNINKQLVVFSSWFDNQGLSIESNDVQVRYHSDAEKRVVEPFLFLRSGDQIKNQFQEHTEQAPPALVIEAQKITLIGHGLVVDAEGRRIVSHQSVTEMGRFNHIFNTRLLLDDGDGYRIIPNLKHRVVDGDVAIISQAGQGVYGHWLVDILPRIAFMESLGFTGKYVLHEPIAVFAKELLMMLGIKSRRVLTYNPNKEALYFPHAQIPGSLRFKSAFSKNTLPLVERLANNAIVPRRKIYISRAGLNERNQTITNRAELENIAASYGFEIVQPERLSISDQASLFASAAVLAGEYGSGMHNSIFSHGSCKVLVFQPRSTPFFVQAGLCNVMGQPVGFVFGKPEGKGRIFSIDSKDAEYAFKEVS
jgi:capsular polysaccharide biosynthesis protein